MKYFNELTPQEQEIALENLCRSRELPLFDKLWKSGTRTLLENSKFYAFDRKLRIYVVGSSDNEHLSDKPKS